METADMVKVAVSAAPYSIDKPYSYLVPESLAAAAVPGVRVMVCLLYTSDAADDAVSV